MKKHIALLAAAIMTAATAAAQIPKEYTVAPWHGFSESAVTYSLDDLTSNQLPVALPLFDKYGVKASFNVVTTWVKQGRMAAVEGCGQKRSRSDLAHRQPQKYGDAQ